MKWLSILGVAILLLATTAYGNPQNDDTDATPGSAGHHGSVQSGAGGGGSGFLLTNNENYGLQISHAPYSAKNDEPEKLPKASKLKRRRGGKSRSVDQATPTNDGFQYCAGCLPLTPTKDQEQPQEQPQSQKQVQQPNNGYNNNYDYNSPAQSKLPTTNNGVSVRQQLRRQNHQYQPDGDDVINTPQKTNQVSFSTGHNSMIRGGRSGWQPEPQQQQQQPDYSYSVNLQQGNPGQATFRRGWSRNNNWNQPQAQTRSSQSQQEQEPQTYQWGQKIVQPAVQPQRQLSAPRSRARSQSPPSDPAPAMQQQHLKINDDGGYSFGYNSPDSSRQEERSMDGLVSGSYAYTDPTGQAVQVDYRASPQQGFQAFGPTIPLSSPIPNPIPVSQYQLPGPVQDTPEVQAARAQFFEAYNQQIKFLEQAHAAEAKKSSSSSPRDTWAVPFGTQEIRPQPPKEDGENDPDTDSDASTDTGNRDVVAVDENKTANDTDTDAGTTTAKPKKPLDFKQLPDPIAIPDRSTPNHGVETEEDDELENDTVSVIGREDDELDSSKPAVVKVPKKRVKGGGQQSQVMESSQNGDVPQAGYSYSVVVGGDDQGQGQQQWPYWGSQNNQYQQQQQPQAQPYTVGYQYQQPMTAQPIMGQQGGNNNGGWMMPAPVRASYNFNQMVGVGVSAPQGQGQGQGWSSYQQPQQMQSAQSQQQMGYAKQNQQNQYQQGGMMSMSDDKTKPTSPSYFYYVSVGGNPKDYVTSSNLFNSAYPTSLKAHLVGAIPQDGRHDAQVPQNKDMGMTQNEVGTKANPPVYLDMDPSKMSPTGQTQGQSQGYKSSTNQDQDQNQPLAIVGFIPGALVSLRNGGYVSVGNSAVAVSGNNGGSAGVGGGTSIRIRNGGSGPSNGHQFPLFVFNGERD